MKRFLLFPIACLLSLSLFAQTKSETYVEVLYFHGKQRCVSCRAIEKYAKEVVYKDLAGWNRKGKVRFKDIDISTPYGEKIADKYHVSWSSLYVNRWKNGKEVRNNMTRLGFQYARNRKDVFKRALKQKIMNLIK